MQFGRHACMPGRYLAHYRQGNLNKIGNIAFHEAGERTAFGYLVSLGFCVSTVRMSAAVHET